MRFSSTLTIAIAAATALPALAAPSEGFEDIFARAVPPKTPAKGLNNPFAHGRGGLSKFSGNRLNTYSYNV